MPWAGQLDRSRRRGLSIVELLVAGVISLIVLTAVIQLYVQISRELTRQRATIELSGQMREIEFRLREDLKGVTVPLRPWQSANAAPGYFEIIEGPQTDLHIAGDATIFVDPVTGAADPWLGDRDDILRFTAHSETAPFVGRLSNVAGTDPTLIQSQDAEIIWWCRPTEQGRYVIHRRVLLIRPDLDLSAFGSVALPVFYQNNDISVHRTTTGLVANSLTDLARREFRFACNDPATFPHRIDRGGLQSPTSAWRLLDDNLGMDIVATDVMAFDVKVLDPLAPTQYATDPASGTVYAIHPGDGSQDTIGGGTFLPGFQTSDRTASTPDVTAATGTHTGGAWVDLAYNRLLAAGVQQNSAFSGLGEARSQLQGSAAVGAVYDTWSRHYESDGIDQNGNGIIDEGTDGIDNNNNGQIDEPAEYETLPPYTAPLRAVKVVVRLREPDSGNVRQTSVVHNFVND